MAKFAETNHTKQKQKQKQKQQMSCTKEAAAALFSWSNTTSISSQHYTFLFRIKENVEQPVAPSLRKQLYEALLNEIPYTDAWLQIHLYVTSFTLHGRNNKEGKKQKCRKWEWRYRYFRSPVLNGMNRKQLTCIGIRILVVMMSCVWVAYSHTMYKFGVPKKV